ncbi:hypothetical protein ACOMHN_007506 [Nucella lapillus]
MSSPLDFHVTEELPSGTLVGNVKDSSNVSGEVGEGEADRLQFHILSADGLRITSIFSINSKTGAIFTNAMIDREQLCGLDAVCQLEFDVTVKVDTNFLKLLTVRVFVDDVNDNAPSFPKGEITLTVPESASVNSEIPISGALDKDSGLNTTISYSLQVSSVFGLLEKKQLDGSSALRLRLQRPLDREAVASYSFLILAADGEGPQALTGTLSVTVLVSDVNDNVPRFTQDNFLMTVMETAPVGTVFGHLTAEDGDVGPNGRLTFKFSLLTTSEVTNLFSLNSTSGELSVAGTLQYESGKTFQCVVEVTDLGVPPQVSQAILRILVADAGNTPPKLDLVLAEPMFGDQSALLSEDVQVGTFVGTLRAEDLDEGPEGDVACLSQDSHFSLQDLDADRYGIVLNQTLDREEQQEMNIVLLCKDSGDPPLSATTTFRVIVRDVNDNAPRFRQSVLPARLTENGSGEQHVTRVTATDSDDSTNSVITYSLDARSTRLFSINSVTGDITTLTTFDRETTPSLTLTVYARDSGTPSLTGSATVSVTIADVNDNPPYVTRMDYYVSENLLVGQVVNVSVADQDEGENGTVVVRVGEGVDESSLPFSVLTNGSLKVVKALDRERQPTYLLPMTLTDRGSPPLSSTTTLTVQLVDSNDHTPLFVFPTPGNSSVNVMAEVPVGSFVCQVRAVDADMGQNGVVTYSLTDHNADYWLSIHNLTGVIFTVRSLTTLARTTVRIRVTASDMGSPPMVAHASLDVSLKSNHTAVLLGSSPNDEDRYIIISGVLAGVTFIVAVVVIAVIVHMRTSDLRRQAEMMRRKMRKEEEEGGGEGENVQKLSVLCPNGGVLLSEPDSGKAGGTFVEGSRGAPQGVGEGRGGFQTLPLSTAFSLRSAKECGGGGGVNGGDSLDFQERSSLAGFPEGKNRSVTEDHNSDTSGDTTTCDSGRGASDEEIVYPVPAKLAGTMDPPPRIPPRRPLSSLPHWSRDNHVISTNWALADLPHDVTEEESTRRTAVQETEVGEMDELSFLGGDFRSRSRKGPLHVTFSLQEGRPGSRASALSGGGVDHESYPSPDSQHLEMTASTGPRHHLDRGHGAQAGSQGMPGHFRDLNPRYGNQNFSRGTPSERQGERYYRGGAGSGNGDGGPDLRLKPETLYPRVDRFPRKERTLPGGGSSSSSGWERQYPGCTRTSESLSSLVHSVEDDGSTTTSGSYSIQSEDAANVSLEC